MKKLIAVLLCLTLLCVCAIAEMVWPEGLTPAQQELQAYIDRVNATLQTTGGGTIDVLHLLTPKRASLGMDGIELPEDPFATVDLPAEISVVMGDEGLYSITLRMQDPDRFALVAAACIHAVSPEATSLETASAVASAYAAKVRNAPTTGFEEAVNEIQSAQPRAYFAYYPDQYKDQHNWLQLTLVFARPGSAGAAVIVPGTTPAPDASDGVWLAEDNYNHFEIFVTPTPEPDSAAME